jgi:hypothetical protein
MTKTALSAVAHVLVLQHNQTQPIDELKKARGIFILNSDSIFIKHTNQVLEWRVKET